MESSNRIMTSLNALREELQQNQTSAYVSLSQSFDRLVLGYQNGTYSEDEVEKGIAEIRSKLHETSFRALRPALNTRRETSMSRNYRDLAERLLGQERGTWDARHVEMVQGAISELSKYNADDAQSVARDLQQRMSESVWFGNLELSDVASQIEGESKSIQQSLLDELKVARNAETVDTMQVPETERVLANEESVKKLVSEAKTDTIRSRMNADYAELKAAKRELEALSMQNREIQQNAEIQRANEGVREAALRLMEKDSEKVSKLFNSALKNAASELDPQTATKLAGLAEKAHADHTSESVQEIRNALKSISSPAVSGIVKELDAIQVRHDMLNRIASASPAAESESVDDARLLDARMLFEQKRMQFEQNPNYQSAESDMLKALDYETETHQDSSAWRNVQSNMQQIHQIAQSAAAGDIGLYAPVAGSEYAKNAKDALKLADKSVPSPFKIPTIQSYTAKRLNRMLSDVKQLAYHPSVRSEMGFAAKRAEMDAASQQPLFKRARFSRDNKQVNELLPALYKVSDVKLKKEDLSKPLRKSFKDLNLSAANLELVKIIENQFDPSVSGRCMDKTSGVANDPAQRIEAADNPHSRVVNIISDWVDARKDLRRLSANTQELISTGRMDSNSIASNLKGEAMQLPASVQSKLAPFLGFDLSNVKIFAGPIAAMASEAMGAHAFTLGKNIFLGENKLNFNTAEGLGLLAHELLHTSHFSSGDSVDSKEQAAEAMEARVKKAFDPGTSLRLALEGDSDKKTTGKIDEHSSAVGTLPANSVGARPTYDAEYVFNVVCEKVVDLMYQSFQREKERNGSD
ncbi:MAG: DUF4157 domain-containing protein [Proteobacteria bacterium]|nr:DUF4157 domain-containing protein [Pseudomonadota bacterium]